MADSCLPEGGRETSVPGPGGSPRCCDLCVTDAVGMLSFLGTCLTGGRHVICSPASRQQLSLCHPDKAPYSSWQQVSWEFWVAGSDNCVSKVLPQKQHLLVHFTYPSCIGRQTSVLVHGRGLPRGTGEGSLPGAASREQEGVTVSWGPRFSFADAEVSGWMCQWLHTA